MASLALSARGRVPATQNPSLFHAWPPQRLTPSLLGWVWSMVRDHDLQGYVQASKGASTFKTIDQSATLDEALVLEVVDSILAHLPAIHESGDFSTQNKIRVLVAALQSILAESSSTFAVDFSDGLRLAKRVGKSAEPASGRAVEQDGRTPARLRT